MEASASPYWMRRKNYLYYHVVGLLARRLAIGAQTMIDVGSAGCPYLEWFPNVPSRTSLDLRRPYAAPGIDSIRADFLCWKAPHIYDIALCLQVLEHIPDAGAAARKLLALAEVVVVSVPYQWPAGQQKGHLHDPVDETKMEQWFGRQPNFSYLCREVATDADRLIQVYEACGPHWRHLGERERQRRGARMVTRPPIQAGRRA
jgi:hypothetical protein